MDNEKCKNWFEFSSRDHRNGYNEVISLVLPVLVGHNVITGITMDTVAHLAHFNTPCFIEQTFTYGTWINTSTLVLYTHQMCFCRCNVYMLRCYITMWVCYIWWLGLFRTVVWIYIMLVYTGQHMRFWIRIDFLSFCNVCWVNFLRYFVHVPHSGFILKWISLYFVCNLHIRALSTQVLLAFLNMQAQ